MQFKERRMLRPKTRWPLRKVQKFRGKRAISDLSKKATEYVICHPLHPSHYVSTETVNWVSRIATTLAFRSIHDEMHVGNVHARLPRRKAGHKLFGDTQSVLAQGQLASNGCTLVAVYHNG